MARGPWDSQPTQPISLSTNIEFNRQLLSKRLMSDHCDKEKRRHSDSSDLGDPSTGGLAASGQPHKKMKPDATGDTDMGINKGERETSFEDMNADHSAKSALADKANVSKMEICKPVETDYPLQVGPQALGDQLDVLNDFDEGRTLLVDAAEGPDSGDDEQLRKVQHLADLAQRKYDEHLDPEHLEDAIQCHRRVLPLCSREHADRHNALSNLATCLQIQYQQGGDTADLEEAIDHHREALLLCPDDDSDRYGSLNNLAVCLYLQYHQQGDVKDLEEAIQYHKDALLCCPPRDSARIGSLANLSTCLQTHYQLSGDMQDLKEAIQIHEQLLPIVSSDSPIRLISLKSLSSCLQTRFEEGDDIKDLEDAIQYYREALPLHAPDDPDLVDLLINLACCLRVHNEEQGDIEYLEEAIQYRKQALPLLPEGYADRSTQLNDLALYLQAHYEQSDKLKSLDEAIQYHRDALLLCPPGHQYRSSSLNNLALCIKARFEKQGNVKDLEEATQLHRESLTVCSPDNPEYSMSLNNLAVCLTSHYTHFGDTKYLDEAIQYHKEALLLRPEEHIDRPMSLTNMASCLLILHEQSGSIENLEEAVKLLREALMLCPNGHPQRPLTLDSLGTALLNVYEQHSSIEYLEQAIQHHQEALQLQPPGDPARSITLTNLANCLLSHYKKQGDLMYLNNALQYYREGLLLCPSGNPDHSGSLVNLASCLQTQYEKLGDVDSLKEAIQCYRKALDLYPINHPDRLMCLNNLASGLCIWFQRTSDMTDLEEAIKHCRAIIIVQPDGQSSIRSMSLNNLAFCLELRYEHQGDIQDLEEAIKYYRDLTELLSKDHYQQPGLLNNLANCLQLRFGQQGVKEDLNEAIQHHREALSLCPSGHPDYWMSLNNLALCLNIQYKHQKAVEQLEEAIQHHRDALLLCPVDHPEHCTSLQNLAHCLHAYYQHGGDIKYLNEAIQHYRKSLDIYSSEHPDYPNSLIGLSHCLESQYKRDGNSESLQDAVSSVLKAIHVYPPSHPLLSKAWAILATMYADYYEVLKQSHKVDEYPKFFQMAACHPTATIQDRLQAAFVWTWKQRGSALLDAYATCLQVANQALVFRPSIIAQHSFLLSVPPNLASDAAASAVEANNIKRAVEFLEQGRTLMWAQMTRYRTPLDELETVNPELAAQLHHISHQLEVSAIIPNNSRGMKKQDLERQAAKYRKLAEAWSNLVAEIHKLDGFGTFLQSPRFENLQKASENGPVIIINISEKRCDAIIVQAVSDPICIPLPGLNPSYFEKHATQFSEAVASELVRAAKEDSPAMKIARKTITGVLGALWDDVVLPVVSKLRDLGVSDGSRIWWCPTSSLMSLPLHAAGIYQKQKPNLADVYISSYTPTLSALIRASQGSNQDSMYNLNSSSEHDVHLLVAAQPNAPNQKPLAAVEKEVEKIRAMVPAELVSVLFGVEAKYDAVLEKLENYNWIHLSCHGTKNTSQPFLSYFQLDRELYMLDIMQANLPKAEYAFLSACHTAAGDRKRLDETIHLAAALQFVGFKSVIGTMYAMADIDGPVVTEEVYKYLFRHIQREEKDAKDKIADFRDAAKALHIATRVLRNNKVPVERWINFIHIGA